MDRAGAWLRARAVEGVRVVVIVTGRGKHSPGARPVLRGEIEALLHALRDTLVAGWTLEPGAGAFRVTLRRATVPAAHPYLGSTGARSRAAPPTPVADPTAAALRARAEDALWELGIRPTPELINTEMQRLRRASDDA